MAHASRPTPARRMYVEPRRVPAFDSDYGPYCGHELDPRYDDRDGEEIYAEEQAMRQLKERDRMARKQQENAK